MDKVKSFVAKRAVPLVLVLMCVVFAVISPNFLTVNNAMTVLRQISMMAIMACGVSFVMLCGHVDLSVASIASLSGVVCALVMVNLGMPDIVAYLAALAFGALVGLLNGCLITYTGMNPMIGTLGTAKALSGVAYIICNGGMPIYGLPESAKFIGQGYLGPIPFPVFIMILCLLVNAFILSRTRIGRSMYAVGSNKEVARLSGINTTRIQILSYCGSGLFSALTGIILMSRVYSGQPNGAVNYEMDTLTACIVGGIGIGGGTGNTLSILIGALIVGVINNGLTIIRVSEYWQMIARGGILVFAVAVDSIIRLNNEKSKKRIKHAN